MGRSTIELDPGLRVAHGVLPVSHLRAQASGVVAEDWVVIAHLRKGSLCFESGSGEVERMSAGTVVVVGPGGFSLAPSRDAECSGLMVMLLPKEASRGLRIALSYFGISPEELSSLVSTERPWFIVGDDHELSGTLLGVYSLLDGGRREGRVALKVAELMGCVISAAAGEGEWGADTSTRARHMRIARMARSEMVRDLMDPRTTSELAELCGTSPTMLKQSFRETFGVPIYSWYREFRIRHAAQVLETTDLPIGDVAASVGYSNPSKFTKAFSDYMGATPREWRASKRVAVASE